MNDRRTITSDDFEKIVAATSDVLPDADRMNSGFSFAGFGKPVFHLAGYCS